MEQKVQLSKEEYENMVEYMERMRETIDVLSDEESVKKLKDALSRIESGESLTKEDMISDV